MPRTPTFLGLATALLITGCASLIAPPTDDLARLPVVRFGDAPPASGAYVLLYPAGTPLPVIASVSGSLMKAPVESRLEVSIQRDIYVSGAWASFDGRHWRRADELVGGQFQFAVPGDKDPRAPGRMSATFNLKG